ncbi:MAG: excinuclease ABC subunit UvrA [Bacteroidaceae bacterium]
MENNNIVVKGAKENNLKNVTVSVPKNKLVVFTGVSGSGKSTLAFDTIFAEGQRRYMESLSSYARQFLGSYEKPNVDAIEGLSPTIAINQKSQSHNPRSTVGTVTEIYDYMRLLYGKIGVVYCPNDHIKIEALSAEQIRELIMKNVEGTEVSILAPVVRNEKGSHYETMDKFFKAGLNRMRVDKSPITRYPSIPLLNKNQKHTIDVVVDRIRLKPESKERLLESIKAALDIANGFVVAYINGKEKIYSQHHSCSICGFAVPKVEPRLFSFNSPLGCCPDCKGLGVKITADENLLVPNKDLTIKQGAIRYYTINKQEAQTLDIKELNVLLGKYNIPTDVPYRKLSKRHRDLIMNGPDEPIPYKVQLKNGSVFNRTLQEGLLAKINRLYYSTNSSMMKKYYALFMSTNECKTCHGARLNKEALSVYVGGKNIHEACSMPLNETLNWINDLELSQTQKKISAMVVKEIKNRLSFLCNVGLEYLTLSREAMTLSGGESQRIRLATQIGSQLSGIIYVLDEPSIGLHQKDNAKLIKTMETMKELGNTMLVVEHDEDTMRAADYIIDIGPGAGDYGGNIVFAGTPKDIMKCKESLTGQYLSGALRIEKPEIRRPGIHDVVIRGARCHNLKNIDVTIKNGALNLITGVSGSGKSSLISNTLYKAVRQNLGLGKEIPGDCDGVEGMDYFDKIINVSQDPIGKTPRSNPATYINVFSDIRNLFAQTKEARMKGFDKSTFSFNVKGGRCETCQGDGLRKISMAFLPDVYVTCEVCHGKRYKDEVLQVLFKGKSIADVLDMRAEEAYSFFENIPSIRRKLGTLVDVGLGYIKLGQSSTTLSGGEAQRVKLANELAKTSTTNTLYVMDEPTTGLHSADITKLLVVVNKLIDNGNTVVVIEHNLDFIKCADWVNDLGPDGGERGGELVACGTPEEVAKNPKSYTGQYLKKYL